MNEFDLEWETFAKRMRLISGKEVLSVLNRHLQSLGFSAITPFAIIDAMKREELSPEIVTLISKIEESRRAPLEETLDAELA